MFVSEHISKKLAVTMQEAKIIPENETEIYAYCLDYFFEVAFYGISTIVISLLWHRLPFCIIFLGVIFPIRAFAGGIHASDSKKCTIYSYICFFLVVGLSPYLAPLGAWLWLILFFIATLTVVILSPVDTPNRRLNAEKKRSMKKKCCLAIFILWIVFVSLFLFQCEIYYGTMAICAIIASISVLAGFIENTKRSS